VPARADVEQVGGPTRWHLRGFSRKLGSTAPLGAEN